jgi:glucokinase
MTVMGPGTGLGVAILFPNLLNKKGEVKYKVWPCESGSVHFCP